MTQRAEAKADRRAEITPVPREVRTAADVLAKSARPGYVVVFREASERNASTLSRVLGVGEDRTMSFRATSTVFRGASEGAARARVYHRLAVAVTDLTPDQRESLEKTEGVAAVARNEVRRIPPPPQTRGHGSGPGAGARAADPDAARAADYLQGMRDGIDAALARLKGAPLTLAPSPLGPGAPARRAETDGHHSWCLTLVGIPPGYESRTGTGVKVAVLDTGIDLTHPDFSGREWPTGATASFVPGTTVQDGHGHGTHCAGVVAGPLQSAGGRRYGVAPDVTLLVGKVLDDDGSGWDDQIIDGIEWASLNARILSMSLGSPRQPNGKYPLHYERVAERLLAEGVVLLAAAGNSSDRPDLTRPVENPAACPSILAVAAIERGGRVAEFSCCKMDEIGDVDVSGPGVDVYSSWTGGGFRTISGTSMATPHAAGVAALILEAKPKLDGQGLWKELVSTASPLGDDRRDVGAGLVAAPSEDGSQAQRRAARR